MSNDSWAYRDAVMLDLFRLEAETQVALLHDGLLALEREPQATAVLASLMRAAHSIKGAARVVKLSAAEKVAHAMEDCFVAAQAGSVHFASEQIEVLLHSADCLLRLAQDAAEGTEPVLTDHDRESERLVAALAALLLTAPTPAAALDSPPAPSGASLPAAVQELAVPALAHESLDTSRVVRVTADNLRHLMGLAGESLVEARWLQPFASSLLQLKSRQMELGDVLDSLWKSLQGCDVPARTVRHMRSARQQAAACWQMVSERLTDLEFFVHRAENLADRLYRTAIATHMRPFEDGVQGLSRMVRDLARQLGKHVTFDIIGRATDVDRHILERLEAPLSHLLRNAIDHGIETPAERLAAGKAAAGAIRLEARHQAGMLWITVADDGRGVDVEQLRRSIVSKNLVTAAVAAELTAPELLEFLFLPAFSTATTVTEISGRGVGLDVVRRMAREAGGMVRAVAEPGKGMCIHLQLPLTLSVLRALLVNIAGEPYAFPLGRIERALLVPAQDVAVVQEYRYFTMEEHQVELVWAHDVLEVPAAAVEADAWPVIVVSDGDNRYGLVVDRFLGETDLVVQPLDARLGKIPDISAAAVLEDGAPVLIVDVEDMVQSADHLLAGRRVPGSARTVSAALPRKRVLVVDDSSTVRAGARKLLEQHGYAVEVAVDGMAGWNAVRTGRYDLVITDVDMPRLDGIELVRRMKRDAHLQSLPVMLVSYQGRHEDRVRGLEAGANAYVTKRDFHDQAFMQTVRDLLGES